MSTNQAMNFLSPFDRSKVTTASIMQEVLLALVPVMIFAYVYFGVRALVITLTSVASSVLFEFLFQKLTHRKVTISDFSAVVTGVLLAFNLPVSVPLWMPVLGSAVAIIGVKQLFGGIGRNYVNPALVGRYILWICFTGAMSTIEIDGVSVATPLTLLRAGMLKEVPSYMSCFLGVIPGSIGETSKILLMLGGGYLILRRIIDFRIPLSFIGTVYIMSLVLGGHGLYEILTGGLFLAAFFMATDTTTSPIHKTGKWIFGIGCGIITALIRFHGGTAEGVTFGILLMNLCVPLINKITAPRAFGETGFLHFFSLKKSFSTKTSKR